MINVGRSFRPLFRFNMQDAIPHNSSLTDKECQQIGMLLQEYQASALELDRPTLLKQNKKESFNLGLGRGLE
jgi:hypothetical protein